ncbi:DNA (cytosine-5-)-methyltransferase, partial [Calothrix sp. HK-06]
YRHPRTYQRRGIFSIDEPSPTIRSVNRPVPKSYRGHPGDAAPISSNLRPLTTIERSYIQTFPKDFIFDEQNQSKTDLEQMIGNAVPVKLAEFVARCLLQHIKDKL